MQLIHQYRRLCCHHHHDQCRDFVYGSGVAIFQFSKGSIWRKTRKLGSSSHSRRIISSWLDFAFRLPARITCATTDRTTSTNKNSTTSFSSSSKTTRTSNNGNNGNDRDNECDDNEYMTGTVRLYIRRKQYGFIRTNTEPEMDLFFHQTAIVSPWHPIGTRKKTATFMMSNSNSTILDVEGDNKNDGGNKHSDGDDENVVLDNHHDDEDGDAKIYRRMFPFLKEGERVRFRVMTVVNNNNIDQGKKKNEDTLLHSSTTAVEQQTTTTTKEAYDITWKRGSMIPPLRPGFLADRYRRIETFLGKKCLDLVLGRGEGGGGGKEEDGEQQSFESILEAAKKEINEAHYLIKTLGMKVEDFSLTDSSEQPSSPKTRSQQQRKPSQHSRARQQQSD